MILISCFVCGHHVISDVREVTVCPLTIKESDMTPDECMTLEVYAEQYCVQSEKKHYTVCYKSK